MKSPRLKVGECRKPEIHRIVATAISSQLSVVLQACLHLLHYSLYSSVVLGCIRLCEPTWERGEGKREKGGVGGKREEKKVGCV
jgi:hypothetical protein